MKRTRELIADFSKGYAAGWKFIVRPCNYTELDILYGLRTDENVSSEKKIVLTQGTCYNFLQGSIFYDNMVAYTDNWEDALKKINISLQVDWVSESIRTKKEPIYGTIHFSVYKPNRDLTRLEKISSFSCRQDEFVSLLKTGEFIDTKGNKYNLYDDSHII